MAYAKNKVVKLWTQKKAALYVRVSTRYQVDKYSLPFQRKKLKEYCKFLEIDKYVIFEDDGYSAKNTDRPHFQEMMSRIRTGEFSHVIVWKVDRVSRNLLDFAAMYQELKDHKVTFISMNEQFDTSTAIGEAMLKIILIFAELERNMTSERVTGIMLDRAEQGLWNGARMPVGYRWNEQTKFPEPDPEEVKIVQLIFDRYEEWRSSIKIARFLNNKNFKSKRGGEWTSRLIYDIIRNPFYVGTYRYNMRESGRGPLKPESEWIVRENNHPGIISKDQFDRCNKIMDENASRRDTSEMRARKFVHTFSGHLVCSNCGSNMIACKDHARTNGWRPSIYRCAKRSRMMTCDNSKTVNETYLGTFVFNYIANLARVQKNFTKITSTEKLESELLKGEAFEAVSGIIPDSLNSTFQALLYSNLGNGTYVPDIALLSKFDEVQDHNQIDLLNTEIEKSKNAITRLTDVYLYDPASMTKEEVAAKKKELIKKILKNFVDQIVDRIVIKDGRIQSITFVNGLTHEFFYSRPAELPVCKKCGGRIGSTCGCRTRTFSFNGKRYQRIKVGDPRDALYGQKNPVCPECYAKEGRWHHWLCGIELCPICGKPLQTCEHGPNGKE